MTTIVPDNPILPVSFLTTSLSQIQQGTERQLAVLTFLTAWLVWTLSSTLAELLTAIQTNSLAQAFSNNQKGWRNVLSPGKGSARTCPRLLCSLPGQPGASCLSQAGIVPWLLTKLLVSTLQGPCP